EQAAACEITERCRASGIQHEMLVVPEHRAVSDRPAHDQLRRWLDAGGAQRHRQQVASVGTNAAQPETLQLARDVRRGDALATCAGAATFERVIGEESCVRAE